MLINVDAVSFSYDGSLPALQDVSLDISRGERVALTGHNGSGKSTLVKHLNGLLKPSTGKVRIAGISTATTETAEMAGYVALLFQNPDDQICKSTVWEEIIFGPVNLGYTKKQVKTLAEEALDLFNLAPFSSRNPHDLGYSERKMVAMASIVAMATPALVFDEPTAGLDHHEISVFVTALEKLQSQKKTVIVITHDMDFVVENIPRVIALSKGKKVYDGTARNLFQQQILLEEFGLFPPQIVRLAHALSLPRLVLSPQECVTELAEQLESRPAKLLAKPTLP